MHEEKSEEGSVKTKDWLKSAPNGSQTGGPVAQCGSVGDGCLSIRLPGFVLALSLSGSEIWGGLTELPRPRCLRSGGSDGSKVCLWCGFSRIVRVKCSDRARPAAGAQGVTTGPG